MINYYLQILKKIRINFMYHKFTQRCHKFKDRYHKFKVKKYKFDVQKYKFGGKCQ